MSTNPSGRFQNWEAQAVGRNQDIAINSLEHRLGRASDKPTWKEACKWAYECLEEACSEVQSWKDVELAVLTTSATGSPEVQFFSGLGSRDLLLGPDAEDTELSE